MMMMESTEDKSLDVEGGVLGGTEPAEGEVAALVKDGKKSKWKRPRVHFACATEPIRESSSAETLCGTSIKRAEFHFHFEGELNNCEQISTIGNCPHCRSVWKEKDMSKFNYVYGIAESELAP